MAPENGALLTKPCGAASGFDIGSATQKAKFDTSKLHGANCRILMNIANLAEEMTRVIDP